MLQCWQQASFYFVHERELFPIFDYQIRLGVFVGYQIKEVTSDSKFAKNLFLIIKIYYQILHLLWADDSSPGKLL